MMFVRKLTLNISSSMCAISVICNMCLFISGNFVSEYDNDIFAVSCEIYLLPIFTCSFFSINIISSFFRCQRIRQTLVFRIESCIHRGILVLTTTALARMLSPP